MFGCFKKKAVESVLATERSSQLNRVLGATDLILLGLGSIVGTGVFLLTGLVAATKTGPAVVAAFAIAGFTSMLVALVYTELASMLPTAGSNYTYTQIAFGELPACWMGGVFMLELGCAIAAVAASWSGYLQTILVAIGRPFPDKLTKVPSAGGLFNLPAMMIIAFVGLMLYWGTKESKRVNNVLVLVKMTAISLFVILALPHVDPKNWVPFIPFGVGSLAGGSATLFFAYTGFGSLATTAEECKNPRRDLTVGIIGSLLIATLLYVIVGLLLTGIMPYHQLNNSSPLADALKMNGHNLGAIIVAMGIVGGMTTVMLMNLYGLSRIFYTMARDRLLPDTMTRLHPRYGSPHRILMALTILLMIVAGCLPCEVLIELCSAGALIDYMVAMMIVMRFRTTLPAMRRPFKTPFLFLTAPLALLICAYLLLGQLFGKGAVLLPVAYHLIIFFGLLSFFYGLSKQLKKAR